MKKWHVPKLQGYIHVPNLMQLKKKIFIAKIDRFELYFMIGIEGFPWDAILCFVKLYFDVWMRLITMVHHSIFLNFNHFL